MKTSHLRQNGICFRWRALTHEPCPRWENCSPRRYFWEDRWGRGWGMLAKDHFHTNENRDYGFGFLKRLRSSSKHLLSVGSAGDDANEKTNRWCVCKKVFLVRSVCRKQLPVFARRWMSQTRSKPSVTIILAVAFHTWTQTPDLSGGANIFELKMRSSFSRLEEVGGRPWTSNIVCSMCFGSSDFPSSWQLLKCNFSKWIFYVGFALFFIALQLFLECVWEHSHYSFLKSIYLWWLPHQRLQIVVGVHLRAGAGQAWRIL